MITILITDDHTLLRDSWTFILNSDPRFRVIAQSGSGEEAVTLAKQLQPDIVMMDINLPGMNGLEATRMIHQSSPLSKILGVSFYSQPAYARKMIRNGAMGYITKNSSREEMVRAIVEIHNNRKYVCQEIKNILSEQSITGEDHPRNLHMLTKREMDIVGYITKGLSSKEIARLYNLSARTIEVHRYNILKKLDLRNVAALVNYVNNSNS